MNEGNQLPTTHELQKVLRERLPAFREFRHLKIVARERNTDSSTFCSENLRIIADNQFIDVFCKFNVNQNFARGGGYGPRLEAYVYRELLEKLPVTQCKCFGYVELHGGRTGALFLERLVSSRRLNRKNEMVPAAEWIGTFQRCASGLGTLSTIPTRGRDFIKFWIGEFAKVRPRLEKEFPIISAALNIVEYEMCRALAEIPADLTHGEYYPNNILLTDKASVFPVDWETACHAPGVYDLAQLVEGWGAEIENECLEAYARARQSPINEKQLQRQLAAASAFWQLRWLCHPRYLNPNRTKVAVSRLLDAVEAWQSQT